MKAYCYFASINVAKIYENIEPLEFEGERPSNEQLNEYTNKFKDGYVGIDIIDEKNEIQTVKCAPEDGVLLIEKFSITAINDFNIRLGYAAEMMDRVISKLQELADKLPKIKPNQNKQKKFVYYISPNDRKIYQNVEPFEFIGDKPTEEEIETYADKMRDGFVGVDTTDVENKLITLTVPDRIGLFTLEDTNIMEEKDEMNRKLFSLHILNSVGNRVDRLSKTMKTDRIANETSKNSNPNFN